MDELQMINSLLDKPAPSDAVAAAGRDRLRAAARTPAGRMSARRKPKITLLTGGLGLTAAGAAVAVAMAVSGTGTPAGTSDVRAKATPASAQTVLLAAATRAETAPTKGAYWHVRTVEAERNPAPGRTYVLEQRRTSETWIPSDAAESTWLLGQELGTRPATAADAEAWRRDGSPTSFPVPGSKCVLTKRSCAVPKMRPAAASKMPERYGVGRLGNSMLTITQARALPSDPARLKVLLIKRLSGGNAKIDRNIVLFEMGTALLSRLPVSAEVRAASYRMMAALPGVRSHGSVKDVLGRSGQAVSMTGEDRGITERLIIDSETGLPLAIERVRMGTRGAADQVIRSEVILSLGWTDERPRLREGRSG
ncbi:CU044_5270 family protein [Actinomadura sp. HBU206391]|uniref:CU044_5270 family protein n=1 Tax=Actinomadura sp. HBU206391 TaxID=2731692 RepID=UPI0016505D6A|nr:CU044_5270 family protein [Actinomadura sp. HBU206391]MBC6457586.1 CU044_5270 family protein [Actinomadura sp. HBU206391]